MPREGINGKLSGLARAGPLVCDEGCVGRLSGSVVSGLDGRAEEKGLQVATAPRMRGENRQ